MKDITLRVRVSHRGGGIEIALDTLGFEDEKMTAYQNHLGGGMLGRIGNDCTIEDWSDNDVLLGIADKLSKYFYSLAHHDEEWVRSLFKENQSRPLSAY